MFKIKRLNNSKKMQKLSEQEIKEKEDLIKLYVNEKKSIAEIKNIYGCSWYIVKSKLKKYDISIRLKGSFLVDDDGELLYSKFNKCEITKMEYYNKWAKSKGFKNIKDYNNEYNHKSGRCLPMSENKECAQYLGVIIAERILPLIFNNVEMKPYGYPGYDAICSRNLKIQVKSSCLHIKDNSCFFSIKKNKVADYFFMVAFDNRENLNVIHIWLIKSDENIKTQSFDGKLNERSGFTISNSEKILKKYVKYEIVDKLEEIQKICNEFKGAI